MGERERESTLRAVLMVVQIEAHSLFLFLLSLSTLQTEEIRIQYKYLSPLFSLSLLLCSGEFGSHNSLSLSLLVAFISGYIQYQ